MKKIVVLLALAAVVLSSCGKKEGAGADYGLSKKNSVVWWQIADITNLVPYVTHDASASYAYQLIWEPLNSTDLHTQKLIPWIAALPEISADHLVYTYTINPKAAWSDGQAITGEDVIYSFKTAMNPNVLDATSLRNYLISIDSIGYVGGDKMKIAFYLHEPYFQMDIVLGGGYVPILPKHIFDAGNITDNIQWSDLKKGLATSGPVKQYADAFDDLCKDRSGKYYIGSGPYLFKEWKTYDHVTLGKNKKYWAADMPWGEAYPEEIIFKTINDPNAAITSIKAKEVDYMSESIPPTSWLEVKQPFIKKDTVYYNSFFYLAWNNERPMFRDKKVRWALSHLINRDEIIKNIYKGLAQKVTSPIIFTQPNAVNMPEVAYNVDTAKALLAEAGWADTDGDGVLDKVIDGKKTPFKFTFLTFTGNETRKQVLLVISEQLRKVGIQADVQTLEWSVFLENCHTHTFDACITAISGNASEDDNYQLYHSSQAKNKGSNWFSFINADADKLLEADRKEYDFEKRKEIMKQFCKIFYDEQPITLLWATPNLMLRVDRFDNVEFFRQRPNVNIPFWVTRGIGITPKAGSPTTVTKVASN